MIKHLFKNKKWIKPFVIIFGFVTSIIYTLSFFFTIEWLNILAISLLTTYYMSCIRPMVGYFINKKYKNNFDYNKKWFIEKRFEIKLYNFLNVKKWKHLLPTYDIDSFNLKNQSLERIMGVMCQAEVVHELMLLLSLLPLLLIIPYGTAIVFILNSTIFVIIELCFIIVQRYNRARIKKILNKKFLLQVNNERNKSTRNIKKNGI